MSPRVSADRRSGDALTVERLYVVGSNGPRYDSAVEDNVPHAERLRSALFRVDAPVIVLWGWPGTGKRRFLRWLQAFEPTRCRSLSPTEVASLQSQRQSIVDPEVRYLLVDSLSVEDLLRGCRHLRPQQSLVVQANRWVRVPGLDVGVVGPAEWLLTTDEAEKHWRQLATGGSWRRAYSQTFGWLRPLELLATAAGAEAPTRLSSFFDKEVLDLLPAVEVEALTRSVLVDAEGAEPGSELAAEKLAQERALGLNELPLPPAFLTHLEELSRGARRRRRPDAPSAVSSTALESIGFGLSFLGPPLLTRFDADGNRSPVHVSLRRAVHLLAFLSLSDNRSASREEILEVVWERETDNQVRANFHPTVSWLRRALRLEDGRPVVLHEQGVYRLNPELYWDLDTDRFSRALADREPQIERLESARRLYRGRFLTGLEGTWIEEQREVWQQAYGELLRAQASCQLEAQLWTEAEDSFRRLLQIDPMQEDVYLSIMRIYARRGRRDLVRRQYDRLCQLLLRELGAEPMASTVAGYQDLMS